MEGSVEDDFINWPIQSFLWWIMISMHDPIMHSTHDRKEGRPLEDHGLMCDLIMHSIHDQKEGWSLVPLQDHGLNM